MNVENIFEKFIEEAKKGEIEIFDINNESDIYNVRFNTCYKIGEEIYNEDCPVLVVNNKEQLINKLSEYINTVIMKHGVDKNRNMENNINYYLVSLFSNATYSDFLNPIDFIDRRIGFINDNTFNNYVHKELSINNHLLDGSNIYASVKNQSMSLETPYCYQVSIEKNENGVIDSYELPSISFGISDNKCYIYGVQNKFINKEMTKYDKKIKRSLYKINSNVTETEEYINRNNDYYPENISDVSPSAILALSIFLNNLEKIGIKNIEVVTYMPIRTMAKEKAIEKKLNYLEKHGKINKEELLKQKEDFDAKRLLIQENITEKMIRNFRRLEYHFPNINITSLPMEEDELMHIKIDEFYLCNNDLLNEVISNFNLEEHKKSV